MKLLQLRTSLTNIRIPLINHQTYNLVYSLYPACQTIFVSNIIHNQFIPGMAEKTLSSDHKGNCPRTKDCREHRKSNCGSYNIYTRSQQKIQKIYLIYVNCKVLTKKQWKLLYDLGKKKKERFQLAYRVRVVHQTFIHFPNTPSGRYLKTFGLIKQIYLISQCEV